MPFSLRPMTADDVEAAVAPLSDRAHEDRRALFDWALGHPACRPLVADDGGVIVGTALGTASGRAGWLGAIFVVPERRGKGIGTALTEALCDALEGTGCRTLLLAASDQGRPIYERLGFVEDGWYRVLEAQRAEADRGAAAGRSDGPRERRMDPHGRTERPPLLASFGPADVPEAAALDAVATGEDRRHLLAAFAATPGGLTVRGPDGSLRGFLVRAPWGRGALVAEGPEDALALLDARRRAGKPGRPLRAGLLESNEAGLRLLEAEGWRDAYRVVRMRRGEPLDWRPDMIWGQFSFAVG